MNSICPLCYSPATYLVGNARWWLKPRYVITSINYCRSCNLFFRVFDPLADQVAVHFEDTSYTCLKNENAFKQARHAFFVTILQHLPAKDGSTRILDVGCGYGHFLDLCHDRGWQVYGLEISQVLYHHLLSKKPYRVIQSPIHQAQLPEEFFDIITFIDSLYYLDDPKLALATAHRELKPGGTLLLRLTNRNPYLKAYLAWLRIKGLFIRHEASEIPEWLVGDGIWMFSKQCLEWLLKSAGFAKVRFHYWERGQKCRRWDMRTFYLLTWIAAQMSLGVASFTPGLIITAEKTQTE